MDALLKRASLLFDIPEGASLWEVNDGPRTRPALPAGCRRVGRPRRRATADFVALIYCKERFWKIDLIFKTSNH